MRTAVICIFLLWLFWDDLKIKRTPVREEILLPENPFLIAEMDADFRNLYWYLSTCKLPGHLEDARVMVEIFERNYPSPAGQSLAQELYDYTGQLLLEIGA